MAQSREDTFDTRDLYLAAFLMFEGIKLEHISTGNGHLSTFHFAEPDRCHDLEMNWTNESVEGNLVKYANKLMSLKRLCSPQKRRSPGSGGS